MIASIFLGPHLLFINLVFHRPDGPTGFTVHALTSLSVFEESIVQLSL